MTTHETDDLSATTNDVAREMMRTILCLGHSCFQALARPLERCVAELACLPLDKPWRKHFPLQPNEQCYNNKRRIRYHAHLAKLHFVLQLCTVYGLATFQYTMDRPDRLGRCKILRAVLFAAHLPNSIQRPWIQKVTRKAYREKTSGEYRGYAFLVFRRQQRGSKQQWRERCLMGRALLPTTLSSK
jgi:hypothetical protein